MEADARSLFPVRASARQIARVIALHNTSPRYALATPSFRFRALAALAGQAALGGQREVVIATYVVARLAHDCLPARGLPAAVRMTRAASARSWLSALALPAAVRAPLGRLVDATETEPVAMGQALHDVISVTADYLDGGAHAELDRLARAFLA